MTLLGIKPAAFRLAIQRVGLLFLRGFFKNQTTNPLSRLLYFRHEEFGILCEARNIHRRHLHPTVCVYPGPVNSIRTLSNYLFNINHNFMSLYIYIYIYIYTHTHTYIYTYIYIYIYIKYTNCLYVYIYIYILPCDDPAQTRARASSFTSFLDHTQ